MHEDKLREIVAAILSIGIQTGQTDTVLRESVQAYVEHGDEKGKELLLDYADVVIQHLEQWELI